VPEAEFPVGEAAASLNERGKANRQERPPRRGGLAQQGDLGRRRGIPQFALRTLHSVARARSEVMVRAYSSRGNIAIQRTDPGMGSGGTPEEATAQNEREVEEKF